MRKTFEDSHPLGSWALSWLKAKPYPALLCVFPVYLFFCLLILVIFYGGLFRIWSDHNWAWNWESTVQGLKAYGYVISIPILILPLVPPLVSFLYAGYPGWVGLVVSILIIGFPLLGIFSFWIYLVGSTISLVCLAAGIFIIWVLFIGVFVLPSIGRWMIEYADWINRNHIYPSVIVIGIELWKRWNLIGRNLEAFLNRLSVPKAVDSVHVSTIVSTIVLSLLVATTGTWITFSVAEPYFPISTFSPDQKALSSEMITGNGSEKPSPIPPEFSKYPKVKIGMTLSGGGYRAALLHAGVLDYLNENNIHINFLSTVSGGSIIGAYYAMGGKPYDFKRAVVERKLNFIKELIKPQNLIKLLGPMNIPLFEIEIIPSLSFDRVDLHADLLSRVLFKEKTLDEINDASSHLTLQLCMTDIKNGGSVGIIQSDDIITTRLLSDTDHTTKRFQVKQEATFYKVRRDEKFRVADLVAMSAGFPIAFNSKRLDLVSLSDPGKQRISYLGDGGMLENLGLGLLLSRLVPLEENSEDGSVHTLNLILVSDGGKHLEVEIGNSYDKEEWKPTFINELSRLPDVLTDRAPFIPKEQKNEQKPRIVYMRPTAEMSHADKGENWFSIFNKTEALALTITEEQAEALFALGRAMAKHFFPQIEQDLQGI